MVRFLPTLYLSSQSYVLPRWFFAIAVVSVVGIFSSGVAGGWVDASSSRSQILSGTVPEAPSSTDCGDSFQQIGFLNSLGDPIGTINLDIPGDSIDVQICADSLVAGETDTVQVVLEHDDSVVSLSDPICTGLLEGGLSSPSVSRTPEDDASVFICTKPGGVSGESGSLVKITVNRTGTGAESLVFRESGSTSTEFLQSGNPVSISGFATLDVDQENPPATATPVSAPPFVFIPPTATPIPTQPATDPLPGLRFEPPTVPTSFAATPGVNSITLSWAEPEDTSGRSIDLYTIQNLRTGEIVRVDGEILSYTFVDLDPEIDYNFTIKASTGLGNSPTTGVGPVSPLSPPVVAAAPTSTPLASPTPARSETVEGTATPIPTATATPTIVVVEPSVEPSKTRVEISTADADTLADALKEIIGSDVSVDAAEVTLVSSVEGINVRIPVGGLAESTNLDGVLEIQLGQLELSVLDGDGTAEIQIASDIAVTGIASVSARDNALDIQISEPVLNYSPETIADDSFSESSIPVEIVGVSFEVDLDELPGDVSLTTSYSADPSELESTTGTTFSLSSDDELAYFVEVKKSGITQDEMGDNTVSMNVSLEWLDAMVTAGKEIAITKVSDSGEVFTEAAQCERLVDIAVCSVTFSGEAGGFSVFAIYGYVNVNPQPAPILLATQVPAPVESPVPTATLVASGSSSDLSASPTTEVAPPPTDGDVPVPSTDIGGYDNGGVNLFVIAGIALVVVVAGGVVISVYYRRPNIPTTGLLVMAVSAGVLVLLAGNLSVVQADGVPDGKIIQKLRTEALATIDNNDFRYRKVGSQLRALSESHSAGTLEEWPGFSELSDSEAIDPSLDVTVWFDSPENVDLNALGQVAVILNRFDNVVEARAPVRLAHQLSYVPGVLRVERITPPQASAITSEGTTVHGSPAWNNVGLDGAGVKVGIIDAGFDGWSAISPTELPAPTALRCYTSIGNFTANLSDCENGEVHGTAVSEAVNDIAPNAELYIANPISQADLLATTQWMTSQGVEIINHSVGWLWDGPGDGTSLSAISPLKSVDFAASSGTLWVNAAGNNYGHHWYGSWKDSSIPNGWLEYSGSDESNMITLESTQEIKVQLRWDDSWDAAASDFGLCVWTISYSDYFCSNELQTGTAGHIPYEYVSVLAGAGTYRIEVFHSSGSIPSWLQLNTWSQEDLEYIGDGRSITNPAESANQGMLAVGAAAWSDTSTIENFSSWGPTTDGRIKPDVVGADRGESQAYLTLLGDGDFPGTSQAAPHVAGLAALVLQRFPTMTPAELATYLKDGAAERGVAGPDNTWGYGFAGLAAPAAPTAVSDSYSVDEDNVLGVTSPSGVLSNDSDDADTFTSSLVATATDGAITLNSDGSFTYTPNANFNGSDTFTYKAVDPWQESSAVSVNLTINPVDDPPTGGLAADSTAEDVDLPIAMNTTDVDLDALTYTLTAAPGNGSLTLGADGSGTYEPDLNFNGADSFTFDVSDGNTTVSETVNITVNPVNDPPVPNLTSITIDEDTVHEFTLSGTDVDGDALSFAVSSQPANGNISISTGGSGTFTPASEFNGIDSIVWDLSDGTETVTSGISVVVNPVADISGTVGVQGVTDHLSISAEFLRLAYTEEVSGSNSVPIAIDGSFAPQLPSGTYLFNGTVLGYMDRLKSSVVVDTADLSIGSTVLRAGDSNRDGTIDESDAVVILDAISSNWTPAIGLSLCSTAGSGGNSGSGGGKDSGSGGNSGSGGGKDSESGGNSGSGASKIDVCDDPTRADSSGSIVDLNGDGLANGTDLSLWASNFGLSGTGDWDVEIHDSPLAINDGYWLYAGLNLAVVGSGVLSNDISSASTLTATLIANADNGVLTLNTDGSFTYVPDSGFIGFDTFTYRALGGGTESFTATVTIEVRAVPEPGTTAPAPTATPPSGTTTPAPTATPTATPPPGTTAPAPTPTPAPSLPTYSSCSGTTAVGTTAPSLLVTNGSFEEGSSLSVGGWMNLGHCSNAIPGWTVINTVEWHRGRWEAYDAGGTLGSNHSISLNNAGEDGGIQSQNISTVPGSSYRLKFRMSGRADGDTAIKLKTIAVLVDGVQIGTATYDIDAQGATVPSPMNYAEKQFVFTASSSTTTIELRSTTNLTNGSSTTYGPVVDQVELSYVNTGTILFRSDRTGTNQLYTMNPDGSNQTQIPTTGYVTQARWSPDKSKIAFLKQIVGEEGPDLWIMNSDGSGQVELITKMEVDGSGNVTGGGPMYSMGGLSFSPDGTRIAMHGDKYCSGTGTCEQGIYVVDLDDIGTLTRIVSSSSTLTQPQFTDWNQNDVIVFESPPSDSENREFWSVNSDGSQLLRLSTTEFDEGTARYSPNADKIVFQYTTDSWIMNSDGTNRSVIGESGDEGSPTWSPDQSQIAFSMPKCPTSGCEGQNMEIWVMDSDGTGRANITNSAGTDQILDWR